jgi:hypothetical protein
MDQPTEKLVAEPAAAPTPKSNRGWFRAGDERINKQGRPRGSRKRTAGVADVARRADRLKRLEVEGELLMRLLRRGLRNEPGGAWKCAQLHGVRLAGCRFDEDRGTAVLILWSESFPRVARGAPIPAWSG